MAGRAARRTPHQTFRETSTTHELPYPLTALLCVTKQGWDTRILIATETLCKLLVQHPRVTALYAQWENRYRLYGLADDVYLYSVQLAKDLNLPDVMTLNQQASMIDLDNLSDETRGWLHRREAAAARFQQAIQDLPRKKMVQQARLVIGQIFTRALRARVGQPSPDLATWQLLEWIARAARAVDGKVRFSLIAATRDTVTPGREPRKKKDSLKRNVTWWFRSAMQGSTKGQLAREYHQRFHRQHRHHWKNDKGTITDGIGQAEALLRESPLFTGTVKSHTP